MSGIQESRRAARIRERRDRRIQERSARRIQQRKLKTSNIGVASVKWGAVSTGMFGSCEYEFKHNHNKMYFELYQAIVKLNLTCPITHVAFYNIIALSETKVGAYYTHNYMCFATTVDKEIFNEIYYKTCRAYNALNKFANVCKYKYTKKYDCDYDMCMNSLNDYGKNDIIELIENGRRYRFWGKDMYRLITKKLIQRYDFFPEPSHITNPYTNSKLSLAALYNVYFFLKGTTWGVPRLYECYFQTNFNMKYFMEFYVGEIRDEIVNDIVKFMNDADVLRYTNLMLQDNSRIVNGNIICASYPRDIVRDNMTGYIKLYLLSTKSVCISKRSYYKKILRTKLTNFFGDNPMFGRECIKASPVYLRGSSFEKTGLYTNGVKYYTDIIPNTFYHPQTFDGHRVIGNVIANKHNVNSNMSFGGSNKRRRIITEFRYIPNPRVHEVYQPVETETETETTTLNQGELADAFQALPRQILPTATATADDSDSDDGDVIMPPFETETRTLNQDELADMFRALPRPILHDATATDDRDGDSDAGDDTATRSLLDEFVAVADDPVVLGIPDPDPNTLPPGVHHVLRSLSGLGLGVTEPFEIVDSPVVNEDTPENLDRFRIRPNQSISSSTLTAIMGRHGARSTPDDDSSREEDEDENGAMAAIRHMLGGDIVEDN